MKNKKVVKVKLEARTTDVLSDGYISEREEAILISFPDPLPETLARIEQDDQGPPLGAVSLGF